mmetsp:Transcript_5275/g.15074  ORF Transcript_5275/g.15074 Transcript_5275/m.15074 type:complete len:307 (-) Transcript_5275:301-1221(-)
MQTCLRWSANVYMSWRYFSSSSRSGSSLSGVGAVASLSTSPSAVKSRAKAKSSASESASELAAASTPSFWAVAGAASSSDKSNRLPVGSPSLAIAAASLALPADEAGKSRAGASACAFSGASSTWLFLAAASTVGTAGGSAAGVASNSCWSRLSALSSSYKSWSEFLCRMGEWASSSSSSSSSRMLNSNGVFSGPSPAAEVAPAACLARLSFESTRAFFWASVRWRACSRLRSISSQNVAMTSSEEPSRMFLAVGSTATAALLSPAGANSISTVVSTTKRLSKLGPSRSRSRRLMVPGFSKPAWKP